MASVITQSAEREFGRGAADGVEDDIDSTSIVGGCDLLAPGGGAGLDRGVGTPQGDGSLGRARCRADHLEYSGSIARFAQTDLAEPGIDSEAWSIISLAGNFLWPVWAHSHSRGEAKRHALAKRFAHEMLRLSMYGTINAAKFPDIAAQLADDIPARPALRAAG